MFNKFGTLYFFSLLCEGKPFLSFVVITFVFYIHLSLFPVTFFSIITRKWIIMEDILNSYQFFVSFLGILIIHILAIEHVAYGCIFVCRWVA